jgi:hypothetical protein
VGRTRGIWGGREAITVQQIAIWIFENFLSLSLSFSNLAPRLISKHDSGDFFMKLSRVLKGRRGKYFEFLVYKLEKTNFFLFLNFMTRKQEGIPVSCLNFFTFSHGASSRGRRGLIGDVAAKKSWN